MIKIEKIEAKNFLSIGNQWQEYEPQTGITLVTGFDKDKQRSNGAGKTTFLETVPFALFGQTTKQVTQAKTVNWKNKKNCEAKIHFSIGTTPYMIHRGIKPKILRLWVDGEERESPSSSVEFQKQIEEEIIGMDFKTFCNLVHSNPNNSISLFAAKKADKRAFLERLFNLGEYSDLNKITTDKLRNTNTEIVKLNSTVENSRSTIEYIKRDIAQFTTQENTDDLLNKIRMRNEQIEHPDNEKRTEDLATLRKLMVDNEKEIQDNGKKVYAVDNQITANRVKLNKIGDVTKKRLLIKKAEERIKELSKINFEKEREVFQAEYNWQEKSLRNNKETEVAHRTEKNRLQKEINEVPTGEGLEDALECPTCFQEVDYEHIQEHIKEKKRKLNISFVKASKAEDEFIMLGVDCTKEMEHYKGKLDDLKLWEDTLTKLRQVVLQNNLDHYDELIEEQKKLEIELEPLHELDVYLMKIGENLVGNIENHEKEEEKIARLRTEVENLEKVLEETGKAEAIKKRKEKEVEGYETELLDLTTRLNKLNTVKDYLEFIKDSLKDENVKQHAISSILPFLNKQTNYYLSKSGHSFFVLLDGWLEAEIKGPGIGDCDFGNFSGGESKSIDLALKFACMDIAGLQATTPIDILILDEILDSSIDGYGIKELMDIIKVKQEEMGLKVHIISHREEIAKASTDGEGKDFFNHYVKVIKEDGFTRLL